MTVNVKKSLNKMDCTSISSCRTRTIFVFLWMFILLGQVLAYDPATCIQCRESHVCNPPDCFCCRDTMPLDSHSIPQMVFFTFDDAVTPQVSNYYKELFDPSRKNPNGCPISMTLFISHQNTVYGLVKDFYNRGMEIASHSVTHSHPSTRTFIREARKQKENLSKLAGIPADQIKGWRSPFLEPLGDTQPSVLKQLGYDYDATLTITPKNINDKAITPFTLDYGWPYDCKIKPCPAKAHKGFWEVPVVSVKDYLNKYDCVYVDGCNNPPPSENLAYKFLMDNFQKYYTTNRAPMGINMHASWFYYPDRKAAMNRFIKQLVKMDDVYILSIKQVIAWLKEPTPMHQLKSFQPWNCRANETLAPATFTTRQQQMQDTNDRRRQQILQMQQQRMRPQPTRTNTWSTRRQPYHDPRMASPRPPLVRFWWQSPDRVANRNLRIQQAQQEQQRQEILRRQRIEQERQRRLELQKQAEEQARLLEERRKEELRQQELAKQQVERRRIQEQEQKLRAEQQRQELLKKQELERKERQRLIELQHQKAAERLRMEELKHKEVLKQRELERQRQGMLAHQQQARQQQIQRQRQLERKQHQMKTITQQVSRLPRPMSTVSSKPKGRSQAGQWLQSAAKSINGLNDTSTNKAGVGKRLTNILQMKQTQRIKQLERLSLTELKALQNELRDRLVRERNQNPASNNLIEQVSLTDKAGLALEILGTNKNSQPQNNRVRQGLAAGNRMLNNNMNVNTKLQMERNLVMREFHNTGSVTRTRINQTDALLHANVEKVHEVVTAGRPSTKASTTVAPTTMQAHRSRSMWNVAELDALDVPWKMWITRAPKALTQKLSTPDATATKTTPKQPKTPARVTFLNVHTMKTSRPLFTRKSTHPSLFGSKSLFTTKKRPEVVEKAHYSPSFAYRKKAFPIRIDTGVSKVKTPGVSVLNPGTTHLPKVKVRVTNASVKAAMKTTETTSTVKPATTTATSRQPTTTTQPPTIPTTRRPTTPTRRHSTNAWRQTTATKQATTALRSTVKLTPTIKAPTTVSTRQTRPSTRAATISPHRYPTYHRNLFSRKRTMPLPLPNRFIKRKLEISTRAPIARVTHAQVVVKDAHKVLSEQTTPRSPGTKQQPAIPKFGLAAKTLPSKWVKFTNRKRVSACEQGVNCVAPNCFCKTYTTPYNMVKSDIPQMIYVTIDGSLNFHTYSKMRSLFSNNRRNPNGCPVKGTVFVSDTGSSYSISNALRTSGIEIGMMGLRPRPYTNATKLGRELVIQRERMVRSSTITSEQIKGWRSPGFKPTGDAQFTVLSNQSLYDSSLVTNRGAAGKAKLWPHTLDFGWSEHCEIEQCPNEKHPGVWEVPIIPFVGPFNSTQCEVTDGCSRQPKGEQETFDYLMNNFNNYYKTNRAPFGIRLKQIWFHWYYRDNMKGLLKFLDSVLGYGDVYMTSIWDAIEWIKAPVPLKDIAKFGPWKCSTS